MPAARLGEHAVAERNGEEAPADPVLVLDDRDLAALQQRQRGGEPGHGRRPGRAPPGTSPRLCYGRRGEGAERAGGEGAGRAAQHAPAGEARSLVEAWVGLDMRSS